jgi:hypothetical protein
MDENDIVFTSYGINLIVYIRDFFVGVFGDGGAAVEAFFETLSFWWNVYSIIAILLSLLFFAGFIYAKIRYDQLAHLISEMLHESEREWARAYGEGARGNARWREVETHVMSENPSDWKLAIIEADVMLEEVLRQAGYVGGTIGDMLKSANLQSFRTLRDAWDAHTVRNEIAHAGSDYVLTKRAAQETILKYERVFREFSAI